MELSSTQPKNKVSLYIPKKITKEDLPYSILKIIPHKDSYKDTQIIQVLNAISKYQRNFSDRLEYKKSTRTLIYHPNQPIAHEILFTKEKIAFYYAIPNIYERVFTNKLKFVLPGCEVQSLNEDYLNLFENAHHQTYGYKKHWMTTINTSSDININDELLLLHKNITDNDMILLQYLTKPLQDHQWKQKCDALFNKYKQTGNMPSGFSILGGIDKILDIILYQIDQLLNAIITTAFGSDPMEIAKDSKNKSLLELSDSTKKKIVYDGFKTNINLYIKSNNMTTVNNIVRDTNTIFKDLDNDNSIAALGKTKQLKLTPQRKLKSGMISNTMETKQYFKVVSSKVLKDERWNRYMDIINVVDVDYHKEMLDSAGLLLGEIKKGSVYKPISFGFDKDSLSKPLVFIAPQSGGKSTFLRTYGISALEQGHSIVVFDTIDGKNVTMVRDYLTKEYPDKKIKVLDFDNDKYLFPLLWNEVSDVYLDQINKADTITEKVKILESFSNAIGSELIGFIDTIKTFGMNDYLTPKMRTVLTQLTQLVFMNYGTFSQVKDCLYDGALRHRLLKQLNLPNTAKFVQDIFRIDNEEEKTLRGIETRLNRLMENSTVQKYFTVQSDEKVDFAKWTNEGCAILINIPERKFKNAINPMVTFLVQKLWLALTTTRYSMPEENRKLCHLLIDEPNKFPAVMDLLQDNIIASRKWRLRFVFMIHNMGIFRNMQENLKSAGASFIVVPPTSPGNIRAVESFYEPFSDDEFKETERLIAKYKGKYRFACCSIHYKNANYPCIVKLPLPVDTRYKKIDRSYLNNQCAKHYGVLEDDYYTQYFMEDPTNNVDLDVDFGE